MSMLQANSWNGFVCMAACS